MLIYWLHPVWQVLATLLAAYALFLALPRIVAVHFGQRRLFNWKGHVRSGRWAVLLWVAGTAVGILVARLEWQAFFITGDHAWVGLAMVVLALFGYATGRHMDRAKTHRVWLPALHGLNNAALIVLALWQTCTGWAFLPY